MFLCTMNMPKSGNGMILIKTPFNEKQSRCIQNCLSEIIIIGLILQPLRLINISILFIA